MTSQQRADEHLRIWQLMRDMGIEPELRLPLFDALAEIERVKYASRANLLCKAAITT